MQHTVRRPHHSGSIYRRSRDDMWVAAYTAPRQRGEGRHRTTYTGKRFCDALRKFSEAHPYKPVKRSTRAQHLENARSLGRHTKRQWFAYAASVGWRCEYCGSEGTTKDHRIPIARGGSDGLDNLAVACFWCNQYKLDMTEAEWRTYLAQNPSELERIASKRPPNRVLLGRRSSLHIQKEEAEVARESRRQPGEGSIYQRKSDGRWVGVVDLGWVGGKRVRKVVTAPTLKELRPKFKALKQQIVEGVVPDDGTVEQWVRHWLDTIVDKQLRPSTARTYRLYAEKWIVPHLGKRRLDRLRPDHIRALYLAMEKDGRADATRRQVHAILRRCLTVAEREGRIASNPATKVDPPSVGKGSHGKFTVAEAKQILAALSDDPLRSRWVVALLAGLRQGEALGLTWERVDFERGVILVEQAVQQVKGKGLQVVDLKSKSSYRAVPMVAPVRAVLLAERQEAGYVWGGDKPTGPRTDWGAWKRMLEHAGVPHRPLHAARATTASLLLDAGVSAEVIAEILGHSQVLITRKHYLHGDELMHRSAMNALEALLEK